MTDHFSQDEHDLAVRAGQQAMRKTRGGKDKPVTLRTLRVSIRGAEVYRNGMLRIRLGPLAGARAQLGDVGKVHNVGAAALTLMPIIALTTRKEAVAYIVFPDGTVHDRKISGKSAVQAAEREVVRFNALVAAAEG